jgi:hypothetical protein
MVVNNFKIVAGQAADQWYGNWLWAQNICNRITDTENESRKTSCAKARLESKVTCEKKKIETERKTRSSGQN